MDLVSGEVKADHILCGLLPPSQDVWPGGSVCPVRYARVESDRKKVRLWT